MSKLQKSEQIISNLSAALVQSVSLVSRLIDEDAKNDAALVAANSEIQALKAEFVATDDELAASLSPVFDALIELNSKALAALPGEPTPEPTPAPVEPS
jgi:hypothetical protein